MEVIRDADLPRQLAGCYDLYEVGLKHLADRSTISSLLPPLRVSLR